MKRTFLPASLFLLLALAPYYQMQQAIDHSIFQLNGFKSAVLQMEFLRTKEEVFDLFGPENSTGYSDRTNMMRQTHHYDNLYLCVYGLFLGIFAFLGFRLTRKWRFLGLILLAGIAAGADFFENSAIVEICDALDNKASDFTQSLDCLQFSTWLKWGSLALYFGLFASFLYRAGQWGRPTWPGKILAWLCVLTMATALIAFRTRNAQWEQGMVLAISLLFIGLFLFGLIFQKKDT